MLLLLAQLAAAAELTVFTQTPAAVSVDGVLLEYDEASLLLVARNLRAGKHAVKIETLGRKAITQMDVTLDQTERIDLYYSARTLYEVGGGLVGEPAVTTLPAQVPALEGFGKGRASVGKGGKTSTTSVSAGPVGASVVITEGTTTSVQMGAGLGGVSVVVVEGTTSPPKAPPPPAPPPPPAAPQAVQVSFSLKDSFDMSNVYVDGQRVAEFRTGDQSKTITLMSGPHTVEIKSFTEFDTWFKGTLLVTPGDTMKIGYAEDEALEVYNRPSGAWVPK